MKQIEKEPERLRRESFQPSPIYLGDLQEIMTFGDESKMKALITSEQYEFAGLEDVIENRGVRLKELKFKFFAERQPYSLTLMVARTGHSMEVYLDPRDRTLSLLYDKIQLLLKSREPWYARFIRPNWYSAFGVLFVVASFVPVKLSSWSNWMLLGWGCAYAVAASCAIYCWRVAGPHLEKRHEYKGLIEKYGDKLFFALLGSVLTLVSQYLTSRLGK